MELVVLCNPENRRAKFFCDAASALQLPTPTIISYNDFIDGGVRLSDIVTPTTLFRIDSPGENFEVERKLIGLGITDEEAVDGSQLRLDHGRVRFLKQWYTGYKLLLSKIEADIMHLNCKVFNTPSAIQMMFNKQACQQHLQKHNIAVPAFINHPIANYDDLRDNLKCVGWNRVFIKPNHASSACGVIAYRIQGNLEEVATTLELVRDSDGVKFYNALKVHRYTQRDDVKTIIDFILSEGALVEEWIPKASMEGKIFDVRIVVINKVARFILPRLSYGPITNLHLGNARGSKEELQKLLGIEYFNDVMRCAEDAVNSISGAFYAGVDVLVPVGFGRPRVLEVNAFGDLLPGLTYNGCDTYQQELKEILNVAA